MNTKQIRNRKVSLKTLTITTILVGLLTFASTYYAFSPATINVYLDDLPTQATYTIKTDGTNTWAVRYDGYKFTESTNDRTVIQAVVDLAPTGVIYISEGTYDTSSASIQLKNDVKYHIKGAGPQTKLDAGSAVDAKVFEVIYGSSYPFWGKYVTIEDMTIAAVNGYGIHCDTAQHALTQSGMTPWFTLKNLAFEYCKYGMKINGIYKAYVENIRIVTTVANGIGVWLTTTASGFMHLGDSSFHHMFIECDGSTTTGIKIDATGSNAWLNLIDFYHTQLIGPSTAGSYGINLVATDGTKGNIADLHFYGTFIEGFENAVKFQGKAAGSYGWIYKIGFSGFYMTGIGGYPCINATGNFSPTDVWFTDGDIGGGFDCSAMGGVGPFFRFANVWMTSGDFTLGSIIVKFDYCVQGAAQTYLLLENSATSTGTGTQQTIAHELKLNNAGITPTRIVLSSTENQTAGWGPYLSAATNATHLHITAPNGMDYTWHVWIDWAIEQNLS